MYNPHMKSTLFSPLQLRGITLPNRIVVSPMSQYSATEGLVNDWHFVHYGKFAQAGPGIVMLETAAVEARGRATYGDLGIWSNDHVAPLGRIATFIRSHGSVPALQIGHAGRRAGQQRPWEGHGPLGEKEASRGEVPWQTIGPSPIPAAPDWPVPSTLTGEQLDEIASAFEAAARRAVRAGFDVLEIHCADGHLLSDFLSPIANLRSDAFGGNAERRRAFPLSVVRRVRAVWPSSKPLMCRVSAIDGLDGDYGLEETIEFARELKAIGVDVVDCSTDEISRSATAANRFPRSLGDHAPYAGKLRKNVAVATMAVGLILDPNQAEDILVKGHADLIGVAREMLYNPNWPLHAREVLLKDGFEFWPQQYGWWLAKRASILAAVGPNAQSNSKV